MEFFHPGFYYDHPVSVNIIDDGRISPLAFSTQLFTCGKNNFTEKIPADLGFAGFRIHYPLQRTDYRDEVAVFLGASYFRAVARGQVYGLSARGLAVDTADADGEEFPYFERFWLVKPGMADDRMVIYALLESRSLTGAYRFELHPGRQTDLDVTLRLFLRKAGKKIGLAPLTSMYFYSETTYRRPVDDFRPEIHDSDGLLLAYPTGEYVWRSLINPDRLFVNAFQMHDPVGFGLMQRDADFDHYQDGEARYGRRPGVWVQPLDPWGAGHVELVQIPTDTEKNDNIVAYWVPDGSDGEDLSSSAYRYRLVWTDAAGGIVHQGGWVAASRSSAGKDESHRKYLVDFRGGALGRLPPRLPADAPLEAVVWVDDKAEVTEQQLFRKPDGSWRLVFEIRRQEYGTLEKIIPNPPAETAIEMRAYLKQGENILTETWSYAQTK